MVTVNVKHNSYRKIRRYIDEKTHIKYFCIVDVIGILTESEDANNYWKVFKNRLKKKDRMLISQVNPIKMRAKDGKNYLTDTADRDTMISIVQHIPKIKTETLELLRQSIEDETLSHIFDDQNEISKEIKKSKNEIKLLVDGYETNTSIIIEAMLPGVSPKDIEVSVERKKIIIKGQPQKTTDLYGHTLKSYLREELEWNPFSRVVSLPHSVYPETIQIREERGHLVIELTKVRQKN